MFSQIFSRIIDNKKNQASWLVKDFYKYWNKLQIKL